MPMDKLVPYVSSKNAPLVALIREHADGYLHCYGLDGYNRGFQWWGGNGQLTGTVKKKASPANLPLRRKVFLLDETLGNMMIKMVHSDIDTGAYVFSNLNITHKYTIYCQDFLHDNGAVIADNLTPDLMV